MRSARVCAVRAAEQREGGDFDMERAFLLDILADGLLGAREACRRDTSKHPLEHHRARRVALLNARL